MPFRSFICRTCFISRGKLTPVVDTVIDNGVKEMNTVLEIPKAPTVNILIEKGRMTCTFCKQLVGTVLSAARLYFGDKGFTHKYHTEKLICFDPRRRLMFEVIGATFVNGNPRATIGRLDHNENAYVCRRCYLDHNDIITVLALEQGLGNVLDEARHRVIVDTPIDNSMVTYDIPQVGHSVDVYCRRFDCLVGKAEGGGPELHDMPRFFLPYDELLLRRNDVFCNVDNHDQLWPIQIENLAVLD